MNPWVIGIAAALGAAILLLGRGNMAGAAPVQSDTGNATPKDAGTQSSGQNQETPFIPVGSLGLTGTTGGSPQQAFSSDNANVTYQVPSSPAPSSLGAPAGQGPPPPPVSNAPIYFSPGVQATPVIPRSGPVAV